MPQIIECLKENKKQLSTRCHQKVFKLQETEMMDPELDYTLMRVCKQMIKVRGPKPGPAQERWKQHHRRVQPVFAAETATSCGPQTGSGHLPWELTQTCTKPRSESECQGEVQGLLSHRPSHSAGTCSGLKLTTLPDT